MSDSLSKKLSRRTLLKIHFTIRPSAFWRDNLWFNGRVDTSFARALVAAKKAGLVPCASIIAESLPRFHPSWCGFLKYRMKFCARLPAKKMQVYQMSTKKGRQSLAGQGPHPLTFFRTSTRCLPTKLFYIESGCFCRFCPVFIDLKRSARGVTRPCQVEKVGKPRKIWTKQRKMLRKG